MPRSCALAALLTLIVVAASGGTAAAKGNDRDGGKHRGDAEHHRADERDRGGGHRGARHSLRAPLTGENFYFVMADRFENGRSDNDLGGLPADKMTSGFDPTDKGYYHGGDLAGLIDRIDYIKGLGTTAIWLTPSFKNKAVQDNNGFPSAGYHGYWITDFTQIDPHLGTNAELRRARRRRARARDEGLLRHHHQPHRGRHRLRGGRRARRTCPRTASPTAPRPGTPFDDRDYAGTNRFPPLDAGVSFPYTPFVPAGEQDVKVPDWLNDVDALPQPRQHDLHRRELLLRRLLRARRPLHRAAAGRARDDRDLREVDRRLLDRRLPHRHDEARRRRVLAALPARRPELRAPAGQARVLHVRRGLRHHAPVHVALHHDRPRAGRARLPVPGGGAELRRELGLRPTRCATSSPATTGTPTPTPTPTSCRRSWATTTWAASAASSSRPTAARPTPSCWRATGSHTQLMYLSRGNPVVYYGDEQGFTGDGGDQDARQDMFPSQVRLLQRRRPDRHRRDHRAGELRRERIRCTRRWRRWPSCAKDNPALRDGAQQHRLSSGGAGDLRVLAHGPRGAARVRGRAQQRRVARRPRRSRPTAPGCGSAASTATAARRAP